ASRPPAARPEWRAERNAPADGQARRNHAAPAGDDERDLPYGPDAAWPGGAARRRPAETTGPARTAGQPARRHVSRGIRRGTEAASAGPGPASGRPRKPDERSGRHGDQARRRLRRGGGGHG